MLNLGRSQPVAAPRPEDRIKLEKRRDDFAKRLARAKEVEAGAPLGHEKNVATRDKNVVADELRRVCAQLRILDEQRYAENRDKEIGNASRPPVSAARPVPTEVAGRPVRRGARPSGGAAATPR